MEKRKNILIAVLLIAIVTLSVGYALLSQRLDIVATAGTGDAKWEVKFTDLQPISIPAGEVLVYQADFDATTVTFDVELKAPSAEAVYTVSVENAGTINAQLDSITGLEAANAEQPEDLQFRVDGITTGDILSAGETAVFTISILWDEASETTDFTSKEVTIGFNYVQNVSQD